MTHTHPQPTPDMRGNFPGRFREEATGSLALATVIPVLAGSMGPETLVPMLMRPPSILSGPVSLGFCFSQPGYCWLELPIVPEPPPSRLTWSPTSLHPSTATLPKQTLNLLIPLPSG